MGLKSMHAEKQSEQPQQSVQDNSLIEQQSQRIAELMKEQEQDSYLIEQQSQKIAELERHISQITQQSQKKDSQISEAISQAEEWKARADQEQTRAKDQERKLLAEQLNLKKTLQSGNDLASRVAGFVDCRSRDVSKREIYIVEGDSALGSVKLSRDAEFQGIMPVRGKILNCLKVEYDRIFKSEIITDLLRVLGCGVEVKSRVKDINSFDLSALRWNKIIICTDADEDGYQIRTLILAMLYRLTPTLIDLGYVYIAESPLYEITCKGRETPYFAYNDKEKDALVQKLAGKKLTIMRSKGLGENEPEMMWETTMNPETRRLIKVMPGQAEETARMFDILLGDNLAGRKDYIAENGAKYLDLADIS